MEHPNKGFEPTGSNLSVVVQQQNIGSSGVIYSAIARMDEAEVLKVADDP